MARTEHETPFGEALLEGLREAAAWKRGEVALPVRNVPSLTVERVKAIRKSVAKTSREFSRRFGIPVRTLEGWEQGRRRSDPAASVLLRVIERNPKAVEGGVGRIRRCRGASLQGTHPVPWSATPNSDQTDSYTGQRQKLGFFKWLRVP